MRLARQVAFINIQIHKWAFVEVSINISAHAPTYGHTPDDATIRCALFLHSAINHPSAMFRRRFFIAHNLAYNVDFLEAEDYELVRTTKVTTFQREHAKFLVHCAWPWFHETRKRQALQQAAV